MTREDLPRYQNHRPFHKKTDSLRTFLERRRIHVDLQPLSRLVGFPEKVLEHLGPKRLPQPLFGANSRIRDQTAAMFDR